MLLQSGAVEKLSQETFGNDVVGNAVTDRSGGLTDPALYEKMYQSILGPAYGSFDAETDESGQPMRLRVLVCPTNQVLRLWCRERSVWSSC